MIVGLANVQVGPVAVNGWLLVAALILFSFAIGAFLIRDDGPPSEPCSWCDAGNARCPIHGGTR